MELQPENQAPITPGDGIITTPLIRRQTLSNRNFKDLNDEELQVLVTLSLNTLHDRGISFSRSMQPAPKTTDIFDNAKFEQIACAGLQPKYNGSPDELIPTLKAIHIHHQNEVWYAATFIIQEGKSTDLVRNFKQQFRLRHQRDGITQKA